MTRNFLHASLSCVALIGLAAPAVAAGAKQSAPRSDADKRWAFQPIKHVEPPAEATGWSANAIDRFVRAQLQKHGLEPAQAADKHALIRRATFDVIGLPPTPDEVSAFLADSSPDAFAKLVERYLASPH